MKGKTFGFEQIWMIWWWLCFIGRFCRYSILLHFDSAQEGLSFLQTIIFHALIKYINS